LSGPALARPLAAGFLALFVGHPGAAWAQAAPAPSDPTPPSAGPSPATTPLPPPAGAPAPGAAASGAPAASEPAAAQRGVDDERRVPDYDGRPEHTTVGEVALWVPRVILFPLYVVSEYVVRRPLGWLVSTAEREHWPTLLIDFFTFGDRQGGIVPTLLIDLGMRTTVGVYAFWDDFLAPDNDLRLRGTYGGSGSYALRVLDRFPLGPGQLAFTGAFEARPDNVFHGIGNANVDDDVRSRYDSHISRFDVTYRVPWFRSSYARVIADLREVDLNGSGSCCDDPPVNDQVEAGIFAPPPGMNQVYDVTGQSAELVFDSRWPRFAEGLELGSDYVTPPGTGLRLALRGRANELLDQSLAPGAALADGWVNYGVSLGGHYDLTGQQRSVSATAIIDFVDPIGSGQVPVTDLVSLGGDRPLSGFLANQFVDRSAAAMRFEYRWPVAVWLDGSMLYEAGSVFGAGLSGFDLSRFRNSYGFGLVALGAQDHPFQALVAVGTKPWGSGGGVDSFRFVFGTTAGF
jgi:hypothetical protein